MVTENKTARLFSEENCLFDQDKKVKELLVKAGKKCTTTTKRTVNLYQKNIPDWVPGKTTNPIFRICFCAKTKGTLIKKQKAS